MAEVGGAVRQAGSLAKKIYGFVRLVTIISLIAVLAGYYLEFRRLTAQVAKLTGMVNNLGEQLVGVSKWQEQVQSGLDKAREKTGGLLDKLGK